MGTKKTEDPKPPTVPRISANKVKSKNTMLTFTFRIFIKILNKRHKKINFDPIN